MCLLRRIVSGIVFVTKITFCGILYTIFFDGAAQGNWIAFLVVVFIESLSGESSFDNDNDDVLN
jgi:hypothetical protein